MQRLREVRAMDGCQLPDRDFTLTLREAVDLWWSICFPNETEPRGDSKPTSSGERVAAGYVAFEINRAVAAAAFDLDCKLSDAAHRERVRLKGKPDNSDVHEIIPRGYFSSARGFYLGKDGSIDPFPYPTGDKALFRQAMSDQEVKWHDVFVHRDEFLQWLRCEFPSVVALDAIQMSHTGAAGRPTAKHLVINELERRAKAGEISKDANIVQISRELADWYENGPRKRQPTLPKFIAESIRRSLGPDIRKAISAAGRN